MANNITHPLHPANLPPQYAVGANSAVAVVVPTHGNIQLQKKVSVSATVITQPTAASQTVVVVQKAAKAHKHRHVRPVPTTLYAHVPQPQPTVAVVTTPVVTAVPVSALNRPQLVAMLPQPQPQQTVTLLTTPVATAVPQMTAIHMPQQIQRPVTAVLQPAQPVRHVLANPTLTVGGHVVVGQRH